MSEKDWVVASKIESEGNAGHVGVQVSVLLSRELTEKEKLRLSRITQEIQEMMMEESLRLDPERQESNKKERKQIIDLFPAPAFVREVPNGYCSQWCCKDRPWFLVVTPIGQIVIGWRKRVLSIQWHGTIVTQTADELFPDEETTKEGRSIHAWGYDKARGYISTLMAEGSRYDREEQTLPGVGS